MAASTRSIHSRQRAAGGRSKSSTSSGFRRRSRRRRRRTAALTGRTAEMRAGPRARATAPSKPGGGRTTGARRGRSSARDGQLRRGRRNRGRAGDRRLFAAGFGAQLWARPRKKGFRAAGKVCGEVKGGGGGQRERALRRRAGQPGSSGVGIAGWPLSDPRLGSKSFVAISGTGRGQRRRSAMNACRTPTAPETSASAALGPPGGRRERERGRLGGGGDRIALSCTNLQAGFPPARQGPRRDRRGRAGVPAAKILAGRRDWVGGWPALSRQSSRSLAAGVGSSGSPTVKRRSRRAEASALRLRSSGGGRGALKRQAGAEGPGGRAGRQRRCKRRGCARLGAGRRTRRSLSPALPLARAQAGIVAAGGGAGRSRVFAWFVLARARFAGGVERRS